jgi:hypothetical protein
MALRIPAQSAVGWRRAQLKRWPAGVEGPRTCRNAARSKGDAATGGAR